MKPRPVYTLSENTLTCAHLALHSRLSLAWSQYGYLCGSERTSQRAIVRRIIAAIRAIQGYQEAQWHLKARRNVLRNVPKSVRTLMKRARRKQLKAARRQNFRPSKAVT